MSAPESPIVMSVILELRHYQVLVMQEGPDRWFATISERGTGHGRVGVSRRRRGRLASPRAAGGQHGAG